MRTRLLLLGACVLSCTSAPAPAQAPIPTTVGLTTASNPPLEYSGVYISTPDEDYFTPCGSEGAGDTWSLRFRDSDPHAPFLKKVTAVRGYPPLTHFVRVRGRLGPTGSYNLGFQTRELAVDSVLDVTENTGAMRRLWNSRSVEPNAGKISQLEGNGAQYRPPPRRADGHRRAHHSLVN